MTYYYIYVTINIQQQEVIKLAIKTVALKMDEELHRRLKIRVAMDGKKIQNFVAELVENALQEKPNESIEINVK